MEYEIQTEYNKYTRQLYDTATQLAELTEGEVRARTDDNAVIKQPSWKQIKDLYKTHDEITLGVYKNNK